ncbi:MULTISPECIES: DUF5996 family protein [unclassified Streptomyces]|uniref:DUF5996 family protein n=1 Tax=unclassified Streptomyces TaxID=2593676 RepID=UPI0004CBA2F2|nr:DUF5996 family protein [Streptomyces sp. NRRL F-2747]
MDLFPAIPLSQWRDSKETLHRFAQIVGKIRLASSVRRNHWWNVAFHVTGRGITTRPMGGVDGNPVFTIDFDFVDHWLTVSCLDGSTTSFPLLGQSVASFHREVFAALRRIGVSVTLPHPHPYRLSDAHRPFAEDTEHTSYDPEWVNRHWQVLSQVDLLLEEFASGFSGKVSPVHLFWHSYDLAVTRFSDRSVELGAEVDPVTREAYSREVVSCGFWFGDEDHPRPAFYTYAAPEPAGLAGRPLRPAAAHWVEQGTGRLATLDYDEVRAGVNPRETVLGFFGSLYGSAAALAGWDVEHLASPGGVTDPLARKDV